MFKTEARRVVGTMSGTSLDGVDAAELVTDGVRILEIGETRYRPYSEAERQVLRAALGRWDGVQDAAGVVEAAHIELLAEFSGADLVGFHGQTLAHDPGAGRTHQAGDGAAVAKALGRPVVWDFRSQDMALGGQGAPLAPFYHFAIARHIEATQPLAVVNIGGVANLTWIDPRQATPDAPGAVLAFDTGPGNAPLNDLMQNRLGLPMDRDGALAAQGSVDAAVVDRFMAHPFFAAQPPKSLDRDDFSDLNAAVAGLADADAAATLTACTCAAVTAAIQHCPVPPSRVLVAGGGRLNPVILAMIEAGVRLPTDPIDTIGLDGDMIEAQAFAFLAARVMRGLPTSCPGTTGVAAAVGGGVVSRP